MQARAAESMAAALGSELTIGYTLKEYENLAISYLKHRLVTSTITSDLWREQYTRHHRRDLHHSRQPSVQDDEEVTDEVKYPYQLRILREYTERLRVTSSLFDSPLWAANFAVSIVLFIVVLKIIYIC